jgi:hypothetical protein
MPWSPLRTRTGTRAAAFAALTAGLLGLPAGCETVRPVPKDAPPDVLPRAAEPPAPPPTAPPPGKHATRRGYYVFYHDFEIDKTDPLFAELEALPDQVFGELRLPPGNAVVQVFLFDTQERYERYMRNRYQHLPNRRAYFLQEPRAGGSVELKVFTWMGDHLRTDLRHELTHALLHGVLKDVPLWLDEGLAGYFELPPAQNGVNPHHLDVLRRGPFQPDLGRLEKLDQVRQMEKPEYRESWAWVHFMLRGSSDARQALLEHLQALRTTTSPGPLLPRLQELVPDLDQALADHLAELAAAKPRPRPR